MKGVWDYYIKPYVPKFYATIIKENEINLKNNSDPNMNPYNQFNSEPFQQQVPKINKAIKNNEPNNQTQSITQKQGDLPSQNQTEKPQLNYPSSKQMNYPPKNNYQGQPKMNYSNTGNQVNYQDNYQGMPQNNNYYQGNYYPQNNYQAAINPQTNTQTYKQFTPKIINKQLQSNNQPQQQPKIISNTIASKKIEVAQKNDLIQKPTDNLAQNIMQLVKPVDQPIQEETKLHVNEDMTKQITHLLKPEENLRSDERNIEDILSTVVDKTKLSTAPLKLLKVGSKEYKPTD